MCNNRDYIVNQIRPLNFVVGSGFGQTISLTKVSDILKNLKLFMHLFMNTLVRLLQ